MRVCVLTACFPEVDILMFSCKSDIRLQVYFTSAPWCLVIYLRGSDFYDNVGGESQWSTWVEVFNNIITLFYCTPELWTGGWEPDRRCSASISPSALSLSQGKVITISSTFLSDALPCYIHTLVCLKWRKNPKKQP